MNQRVGNTVVLAILYSVLLGVPAVADEGMYPNKVETHLGTLEFDHGVPTEKTSEKLCYELDYHRAVSAGPTSRSAPRLRRFGYRNDRCKP